MNVFVFCDSKLPAKFGTELHEVLPKCIIKFYDGVEIDECLVHDLMRESKLLVTANSTFSFTAGLLSKPETLVFMPMTFYGGPKGILQGAKFRSSSDFFLMR
jgi:hypothetical protein